MNILGTIPEIPVKDGAADFVQDGLIHCGMCGTPRQVLIHVAGHDMIRSCLCKCRAERYDREEKEFRQKQEAEKIKRMRAFALADPSYRSWTFAADDGHDPKMAMIRQYADNWDIVKKKNVGLLLWGDIDTGKSFASACIVNALTDRNIPCLMTTFISIANELSGKARYDRNGFIASLNRFPLLAIDDLGAERDSEYMQEMVFAAVDARYRSGLPLVVTTNIPLDNIKHPNNITYSRIYDRILEMTVPIRLTVKRRKAIHDGKKEVFSGIIRGKEAM